MMNFNEKSLQFQTQLEARMGLLLAAERGSASKVLEAMRYSALGGGKRVRGILTMAVCEMFGGDLSEGCLAGAAVELLHAYSLIHDDLPSMDNDAMRRGKPSCHIVFGESIAILAGDGLLTLAFDALSRMANLEQSRDCIALLARSAGHHGMVFGQELDLAAEGNTSLRPADIDRIQQYKTGAIIRAALGMGAISGSVSAEKRAVIDEYGILMGKVFQIVDDILDVTAEEQHLGKPVGSDSARGKATSVTQNGLEPSRKLAKNLTDKAIFILTSHFDQSDYLAEFTKRLLTRTR